MNVRNPFTRIYSAWKDKFRNFDPSMGSIINGQNYDMKGFDIKNSNKYRIS